VWRKSMWHEWEPADLHVSGNCIVRGRKKRLIGGTEIGGNYPVARGVSWFGFQIH